MSGYPLEEEIKKRILKGQPLDDLYTKKEPRTIANQILMDKRQYFMNKVKLPLRLVIENLNTGSIWSKLRAIPTIIRLVRLYPEPTYENTRSANTYASLQIRDKFFKYERNSWRVPMFRAIFRIVIDEFEHDIYYASRRDWLVEEIIKAILAGTWQPREYDHPDASWWTEPKPKGGKYSIIYKMWLHRKEIKRILED